MDDNAIRYVLKHYLTDQLAEDEASRAGYVQKGDGEFAPECEGMVYEEILESIYTDLTSGSQTFKDEFDDFLKNYLPGEELIGNHYKLLYREFLKVNQTLQKIFLERCASRYEDESEYLSGNTHEVLVNTNETYSLSEDEELGRQTREQRKRFGQRGAEENTRRGDVEFREFDMCVRTLLSKNEYHTNTWIAEICSKEMKVSKHERTLRGRVAKIRNSI
ncbi:MAG: hypothetical protein QF668_04275 [Arenicellales bacterium]|jgi:hypothetical protein|nr:hypothetical protein [Arenicellales bacterium]